MDGPGHSPARPQPIPNRMDPPINLPSISLDGGGGSAKPVSDIVRLRRTSQAIAIGIMAPPMTNASVGSQLPKTSSQPCTLAVSVIPEISRPAPKKPPAMKAMRSRAMSDDPQKMTEEQDADPAGQDVDQRGHDPAERKP